MYSVVRSFVRLGVWLFGCGFLGLHGLWLRFYLRGGVVALARVKALRGAVGEASNGGEDSGCGLLVDLHDPSQGWGMASIVPRGVGWGMSEPESPAHTLLREALQAGGLTAERAMMVLEIVTKELSEGRDVVKTAQTLYSNGYPGEAFTMLCGAHEHQCRRLTEVCLLLYAVFAPAPVDPPPRMAGASLARMLDDG